MYVLERGLGSRTLAVIFAACTCIAALGIGSSVQSYSIRLAGEQLFGEHSHAFSLTVGFATAVLTGIVIIGGKYKVARVCMWLVPAMSAIYLTGCISVLMICRENVVEALTTIISTAFMPDHLARSVGGGAVGGGLMLALRTGVARGLFTNEAGLGSVPMAAAMGGDEKNQPLISMTGPFWDTVVMCAITGVAVVAVMLSRPELFVGVPAEQYCFASFAVLPVFGVEILSVSLMLFAFATIIGWNVYGVTAFNYLFNGRCIVCFQLAYALAALCGAVMTMTLAWSISDIFNACMAVPNLIALWCLWGYNKSHTITTEMR
jgi:AGCS family alanine or glycine:cation symporter